MSTAVYPPIQLECGRMPNVTVALPNIGGAFCSSPQSLADVHYWSAVHNAAKTQKPLKFAGVPQTTGPISAPSGPKFTILWEHVEEISFTCSYPLCHAKIAWCL